MSDSAPSVVLAVKVVPGASRTRISGRYGDGIKVQVAAAPEHGKANAAVITLLAEWLGIRPNQIDLVAGHAAIPASSSAFQGLLPRLLAPSWPACRHSSSDSSVGGVADPACFQAASATPPTVTKIFVDFRLRNDEDFRQ